RPFLDRPVAVIAVRDPVEVAHSLQQRNGFPIPVGISLWEGYVRQIICHTSNVPRLIVHYADLIRNPHSALITLASRLNQLGGPPLNIPTTEALAEMIDPNLHRQRRSDIEQHEWLNPQQQQLYDALCQEDFGHFTDRLILSPSARRALADFERQQSEAERKRQEEETARRRLMVELDQQQRMWTTLEQIHHTISEDTQHLSRWLRQDGDHFEQVVATPQWRWVNRGCGWL